MAEYLDRDDILNVIDYIRTKYISVYNRRDKCSQFWADTIRYFEKRINKLDEYDVVPVRHGYFRRLTFSGDTIICSECKMAYNIFETNGAENFNLCPHCGAKMDSNEIE